MSFVNNYKVGRVRMKKIIFAVLIILCSISVYAQHTVNDVDQYGGWYKVIIEIFKNGKTSYAISQCYPSGEEFNVTGAEREKLPLVLKVLSMSLVEEYIIEYFDIDELTLDEEGIFLEFTGISFTFNFNFSRPEDELLDELGPEMVNRYRNRRWP
jgi:hypothetical protein